MVQERDDCLSCTLPECIPDHPDCGIGGDTEAKKRTPADLRCASCIHARRLLSDNPRCRSYFACSFWGFNTTGWRCQCNGYRVNLMVRRPHLSKRKEHDDARCRKAR